MVNVPGHDEHEGERRAPVPVTVRLEQTPTEDGGAVRLRVTDVSSGLHAAVLDLDRDALTRMLFGEKVTVDGLLPTDCTALGRPMTGIPGSDSGAIESERGGVRVQMAVSLTNPIPDERGPGRLLQITDVGAGLYVVTVGFKREEVTRLLLGETVTGFGWLPAKLDLLGRTITEVIVSLVDDQPDEPAESWYRQVRNFLAGFGAVSGAWSMSWAGATVVHFHLYADEPVKPETLDAIHGALRSMAHERGVLLAPRPR